jgi:hypothetical protein
MIGLDVGFGWTKVAKDGREVGKFPTWIAYYDKDMADVEPISWEGREYVVGEYARYSRQRIELADIELLVRFLPVILLHVKREYSLEGDVCGGLAPKHYAYYKENERLKKKVDEIYQYVLPQGVGILLDVDELIHDGEVVLVVDVGFNTVDYVLAKKEEKYRKYAIGSIEGLGVLRAVELFKEKLPQSLELLKNFSFSRLVEAFEKGYTTLEGEKVNLQGYVDMAKEEYVDLLLSRLKMELKGRVEERDKLILAGGGANLLSEELFGKNALKPPKPEFSNARGFSKVKA